MNTQITIEQLAEKLNGSLWVKGDLKRIYLNDEGYNTKKMSTKTFVFQDENGDFKVSCKVDCPSQPYQWCESQEDEVKERVYEQIESIVELSKITLVEFRVISERGFGVVVYIKNQEDSNPIWFTEDNFYDKYGKYPEDVFDEVAKVYAEYRAMQVKVESASNRFIPLKKEKQVKTTNPTISIEARVKHSKFGLGTVKSSTPDIAEVLFDNIEIGLKKLLLKFVKLEIVG